MLLQYILAIVRGLKCLEISSASIKTFSNAVMQEVFNSGNTAQYNIFLKNKNIKLHVATANNLNKMTFHTYAPVNSILGMIHMS